MPDEDQESGAGTPPVQTAQPGRVASSREQSRGVSPRSSSETSKGSLPRNHMETFRGVRNSANSGRQCFGLTGGHIAAKISRLNGFFGPVRLGGRRDLCDTTEALLAARKLGWCEAELRGSSRCQARLAKGERPRVEDVS